MHRRSSRRLASSTFDIHVGRQQLAQQFASMDGWQHGHDNRFDDYVKKQRVQERHEGFDQRVERAFLKSSMLHKAEVTNGFKRYLKSNEKKFDAAVLREMNVAVENRLEWLQEVWAQIDADYRSNDSARQDAATQEIDKALAGESSDFMAWAYERKLEERMKGPKAKAAMDAELHDANLPEVTNDEANRYLNLKMNMLEVERRVKEKYGIAGQQHWAMLQSAKDMEYEEKIDRAAEKYKELLDQNNRFEESSRTVGLRNVLERTHEAKVRFKAAMEMENERERLLEAHKEMQEVRKQQQSERRKAQLKEAAEMRMQGKTSAEVTAALKLRALDEQVQHQDEYRRRERRAVEKKKGTFLDMIEKLRHGAEVREGSQLLGNNGAAHRRGGDVTAYGFSEDDALNEAANDHGAAVAPTSTRAGRGTARRRTTTEEADPFKLTPEEQQLLQDAVQLSSAQGESSVDEERRRRGPAPSASRIQSAAGIHKQELWRAIHADQYEDPFTAVHQARLDADKTYDQAYAKMTAPSLVAGGRMAKQGIGEFAAGNEADRHILKGGADLQAAFQWDNPHGIVHNLDKDGEKEYFLSDTFHVRDKKTGDIDWRFERKGGGAALRGPRFYKIGERREARDAANQTVVPLPAEEQKQGLRRKKHPRSAQPPMRSE